MILDAIRIARLLRSNGIDPRKLTDPRAFDSACTAIYKALPFPVRRTIGRKRIETLVAVVRDQATKFGGGESATEREPTPEDAPTGRVGGL